MKFAKSFLYKNNLKNFTIEHDVVISKDYISSLNYVVDIKDVKVIGTGNYTFESSILSINIEVSGLMVINDARTLEIIDYPFSTKVNDSFDLTATSNNELTVTANDVDLTNYILELVALEVPIRVTNKADFNLSGDGWKVTTEDELHQLKKENSESKFDKLKNFFDEQ